MKILLVGDTCHDIYHFGRCRRLNHEAPVPILDEEYSEVRAGMSSNVFLNLKNFGLDVTHFKGNGNIQKHRLVDLTYKQQLLRYDVSEMEVKKFNIGEIEDDYDILVISDYDKGFITDDVAVQLCSLYKDKPVFVDSKKPDLSCFKNSFIKINKFESQNIKNITRCSELIVTLGDGGASYNGKVFKTKKVDVYDVCGAGDIFLASLVFGYTKNKNIEQSIEIANKFAGYAVTKLGSYVLTKEDIEILQQ